MLGGIGNECDGLGMGKGDLGRMVIVLVGRITDVSDVASSVS